MSMICMIPYLFIFIFKLLAFRILKSKTKSITFLANKHTSYHCFLVLEQNEECLRRQGCQVIVILHAGPILSHEKATLPASDIELQAKQVKVAKYMSRPNLGTYPNLQADYDIYHRNCSQFQLYTPTITFLSRIQRVQDKFLNSPLTFYRISVLIPPNFRRQCLFSSHALHR